MAKHRHNATTKAKIALEAIRNERTANEIAAEYQVHPSQISQWKKALVSGAKTIFESSAKARKGEEIHDKEVERLHQKIGQLTVELDWLKKKLNH